MKQFFILFIVFFTLTSFQEVNIEKTLKEVNARFKNVEVSLINWPEDLQQKLGSLKKTAFMALPR
jgi:hypothetical protein